MKKKSSNRTRKAFPKLWRRENEASDVHIFAIPLGDIPLGEVSTNATYHVHTSFVCTLCKLDLLHGAGSIWGQRWHKAVRQR
jgi:hypothetical protein